MLHDKLLNTVRNRLAPRKHLYVKGPAYVITERELQILSRLPQEIKEAFTYIATSLEGEISNPQALAKYARLYETKVVEWEE